MTIYTADQLFTTDSKKGNTYTTDELLKADKPSNPDEGFASHALNVLKQSVSSMASHPLNWDAGVAKAVGSGMYDMAALSIQGLSGMANAMTQKGATWDEKSAQFDKGMAVAKAKTDNYKEVLSAVMHLNLSAPNEEEQAATKLLSLLPESITAAGDTVYEKTGSAIAGAGTQAMLTLLTMKPSVAGKALGGVAKLAKGDKSVSGAKITSVFDELAGKNPQAATAIADHINKVDKDTAKHLHNRIQKYIDASEEELGVIGKKAAEANIVEITSPGFDALKKKALGGDGDYLGGNRAVGGRPLVPTKLMQPTQEQASAGIRATIQEAYEDLGGKADKAGVPRTHKSAVDFDEFGNSKAKLPNVSMKAKPGNPNGNRVDPLTLQQLPNEDPVIYLNSGFPVTAQMVVGMFRFAGEQANKIPAVAIATGKLTEWGTSLIKTFNPEMLGEEAKKAGTIIAQGYSKLMSKDSSNVHQASPRRTFWNQMGGQRSMEFINQFEKGKPFANQQLESARQGYLRWAEQIFKQDKANGFKYEARDNYMQHIFENQEGFEEWANKRFPKWNDPSFIKDRSFDLYAQAIEAGFKPKFTNPEDIMLARQHASDVAQMQVDILKSMEQQGIAVKTKKGVTEPPEGFSPEPRRSPTGQKYWVHKKAAVIMHNAFDTKSLWNHEGFTGSAFRGAMALKNKLVPIKFAISLFHPLHILPIDNATGMVRATKGLLGGSTNIKDFIKDMTKATIFFDTVKETGHVLSSIFVNETSGGNRMLRIYNGKISESQWTAADKTALQYMFEGGVAPGMDKHMRINAIGKFKDALQQNKASALWHAPFALLEWTQGLMFDHWIPSLKTASYLKDVATHLHANPELIHDPAARGVALRKLAKSVDNRYGEMAYNTLFWPKYLKDIAVANTLSLGWQMGFFREYGGGMLDLGQGLLTDKGTFQNKINAGQYDRVMFTTFYTAQALAFGGLLTYSMTGEKPKELWDYLFPRSGGVDKNGKPNRVNTMFYTREFGSLYKHIEAEGAYEGIKHTIQGKASGLIGLATEAVMGINNLGQEIRDPNGSVYKKLEQTLQHVFPELAPISLSGNDTDKSTKGKILKFSGFSPAPQYVTESKAEGAIRNIYNKYYMAGQTSFEKASLSADTESARAAYDAGDMSKYQDIIDGMVKQYDLKPKEVKSLETRIQKGTGANPMYFMFKRLSWEQQKQVLDKATPDERETLLQIANKQHKGDYVPPETRHEDNEA